MSTNTTSLNICGKSFISIFLIANISDALQCTSKSTRNPSLFTIQYFYLHAYIIYLTKLAFDPFSLKHALAKCKMAKLKHGEEQHG